jgi:hypothetical protein
VNAILHQETLAPSVIWPLASQVIDAESHTGTASLLSSFIIRGFRLTNPLNIMRRTIGKVQQDGSS